MADAPKKSDLTSKSSNESIYAEKRFSVRYRIITGKMPGPLIERETMKEVKVTPIDVSRHGLGVLTEEPLHAGNILFFVIGEKKLLLKIMYCHKDIINKEMYRVGLCRVGSNENLEALFIASGCELKE